MKALLVIDYTNDFVADDGALTCGKPAQAIEGNIVHKIREYVSANRNIYVINDVHYEDEQNHPESKLFPKHNIAGTDGRQVYGKVAKALRDTDALWMDKTRYSAFHRTNLHIQLMANHIKEIELCGVCTDICILHTAVDAYNLGYKVTVDAACVASFNPTGHEWALRHFKEVLGFDVVQHG